MGIEKLNMEQISSTTSHPVNHNRKMHMRDLFDLLQTIESFEGSLGEWVWETSVTFSVDSLIISVEFCFDLAAATLLGKTTVVSTKIAYRLSIDPRKQIMKVRGPCKKVILSWKNMISLKIGR